jgi:hypothetical protein
MHAGYYACMKTQQYTIRNIPERVDIYLRKRSQQSGKSLNQVIIDELSERVAPVSADIQTTLSWFIGSGLDDATLAALSEEDATQKLLAAEDL